jgi:dTDP-4-amino-4,6-dideoxygalactose transaminase
VLSTPFSPWPCFTEEEAKAITQVLLSNKVNYWSGEEGHEFEKEFATWIGCEQALVMANGTVALGVALSALNIGPGDEVIVTPRTYFASVSCIVEAGATPVFADVDVNTQNITAETIEKVRTDRSKAIVCVHLAGWPCEMDEIMDLANNYGLYVVEDCAQAHGACYKGSSVGSFGHINAWSFCQDKIMSTGGEGGMITTNDQGLWEKAWSYRDHGKSFNVVFKNKHPIGFRWLHESFGTNGRLTEMQSAIGRIQLKRMPVWSEKRRASSKQISQACNAISSLRVPIVPRYIEHACYKYYVFVSPDKLKQGWTRDRILYEINQLGVPCYTGGCPEVYLERVFDKFPGRPQKRLPIAKDLGETSLMFLVHPTLTDLEIEKTCEAIFKVMKRASL